MSRTKRSNGRIIEFRRYYAVWLAVIRGGKRREIGRIMGVTERTVGNYFNYLKAEYHQKSVLLIYIDLFYKGMMNDYQNAIGREQEYYEESVKRLVHDNRKRRRQHQSLLRIE